MNPHISDPVYLNGAFLPLENATISPLDRGFLYGDGAYELVPVYSRHPFRMDEHLARFDQTLRGIDLPNPHSAAEWAAIIHTLIDAASWEDQSIYLQVTRGADNKRDHAFPNPAVAPTTFAFSGPLIAPSLAQREAGVSAITVNDERWARCDLKVLSLLANVLARQKAVATGCAEALLIRDGYLKEGAASNIFVVQHGTLLAPPKTRLMLPGITYDVVIELATSHGLPLEIREITETELLSANEVWMTSSTKEVLAITEINGKPVGQGEYSGKPGPIGKTMWQWYQDFKNTVMRRA